MRSIVTIALILCLGTAIPMTAIADQPPKVPDGGLVHDRQESCVDPQTGLAGTCFYSHDIYNNRYNAFYVGELAWVIYKLVDGVYVEVWRREPDV